MVVTLQKSSSTLARAATDTSVSGSVTLTLGQRRWSTDSKSKLQADSEGLLAHNVSLRQMREFALTFLQSAARWPGRYGIYDDVSCERMDQVVRKVVLECIDFSSNVSHHMIHTPKGGPRLCMASGCPASRPRSPRCGPRPELRRPELV